VLVVSAPQTPGKVTELADAPKLEIVVTFTEPSDPGSESKVGGPCHHQQQQHHHHIMDSGQGGGGWWGVALAGA